ncbi:DUF5444 family protein [Cronobacter sakazakii]|nr:DUF5444 family protein [Cronobacter sakazakii]ELY6004120.1 DUF5444 family protein [Cronobacter sakazakii]
MVILPVNGTILVQQGNREFNKVYESAFPDTVDGRHSAYEWAWEIAMGWNDIQDDDWNKKHAA